MTISTTESRIEYLGNGATKIFAIPFRFLENSHIFATLVTAAGDQVPQSQGADYVLAGADEDTGGFLTMVVAPPIGAFLVVVRVVPATQETDYISGDPFPAESHERALDKLTMLAQQGIEADSRTLKFPVGDLESQIGELPPAGLRAARLLSFDSLGRPIAIAPSDQSAASLALILAQPGGSNMIGFIQSGAGAIARMMQDKAREKVSVKDFGAIGDGTLHLLSERYATLAEAQAVYPHATSLTNSIDAVGIQAAINHAISVNCALYFPAGTYLANNLVYSSTSSHSGIFGDGSGCTIVKNTIDTNPVLTITGGPNQLLVSGIMFQGNGSVSSWGSGDGVAGNALVGTIPTNACAVRMVNLVHATFFDCYFTHSIWGADIRGGICVTFRDCYAYWNATVGFRAWRATGASVPNSGWPNVITFRDCSSKENGQAGYYFDDGRHLVIDGGDIEGNGKNTVQATGVACGVFIGSNTGSENGTTNGPNGTPFHTTAASISNVWFEQNGNNNGSGIPNGLIMAHIVHNHGFMSVDRCNFTNATAGRHIRINGGQYTVERSSFESALTVPTNYIDEGGTSGVANLVQNNWINNCYTNASGTFVKLTTSNCTSDQTKTFFDYTRYTPTKVMRGSGTTSSGTLAITWPAGTWLTIPTLTAQVVTNDGGTTTYSTETFGASVTGATIRAKQNAAGTVTQPALTVSWIAVGT